MTDKEACMFTLFGSRSIFPETITAVSQSDIHGLNGVHKVIHEMIQRCRQIACFDRQTCLQTLNQICFEIGTPTKCLSSAQKMPVF